jgi:hypothetical protein
METFSRADLVIPPPRTSWTLVRSNSDTEIGVRPSLFVLLSRLLYCSGCPAGLSSQLRRSRNLVTLLLRPAVRWFRKYPSFKSPSLGGRCPIPSSLSLPERLNGLISTRSSSASTSAQEEIKVKFEVYVCKIS